MALTDAEIRTANTAGKLFDGGGLYLHVRPTGAKTWHLKYRFAGKEKKLSFGAYPEVSLKEARARRDAARQHLRDGADPGIMKAAARSASSAKTFHDAALEWLDVLANEPPPPRPGKKVRHKDARLSPATIAAKRNRLTRYVIPYLRSRPMREITGPELLEVLRKVEHEGANETAHRLRADCGRIFRYSVASGYCARDVTSDIRDGLRAVHTTNHPALTKPADVGALLRAIDAYKGRSHQVTGYALRLLPLIFLRSSELRWGEWSEVDFDRALWEIPGPRMKMKVPHVVPLATQALGILCELHTFTGHGRLMFPSITSPTRPISENTVNAALRRMGYAEDEMTGHGFRTIARTLLAELGWDKEPIRIQLAHANPDQVDGAYNRAELLAERARMMQAWADYLDALREGGKVIPIRSAAP